MRNAQTFLRMETPHLWVGTFSLRMETPPLRLGACPFRMETPLCGRSGGHTGAAPTISRIAPCPKVAGEQFADGLNRKRLLANSSPTDKTRNDCRRTVCRRTKSRKGCWRIVRRSTKSRKGWRRTVCRWTKSRKGCWRIVRRWTKSKKVAGEQFADGLK